ncbi:hypothetical protein GF373_08295 [bacterium]|nr:hypothetical protein [bacterium]
MDSTKSKLAFLFSSRWCALFLLAMVCVCFGSPSAVIAEPVEFVVVQSEDNQTMAVLFTHDQLDRSIESLEEMQFTADGWESKKFTVRSYSFDKQKDFEWVEVLFEMLNSLSPRVNQIPVDQIKLSLLGEIGREETKCVSAGDFYDGPVEELDHVLLGLGGTTGKFSLVTITEALLPDGSPVALSIQDCDNDGNLDVVIPWSESNATQNTMIEFGSMACVAGTPVKVDLTLTHGTAIKLDALDVNGNIVDTVSDSGSDPTVVQTLSLQSPTGIQSIVVTGAEICLKRICWECGGITRPTPTPFEPGRNCVEASDGYSTAVSELANIDISPVHIEAAVLPDGEVADLSIRDCDNDGNLDMVIPWSESNANPSAMIEFDDQACPNGLPREVELTLTHGTAVEFQAVDVFGNVVDTVSDSGSDPTQVQTLKLISFSGIQRILVNGAEICLKKICWRCLGVEIPTPTMRPEGGDCVTAQNYTGSNMDDLAEIALGPVTLTQANLPDGDPVPLSINDCDNDGQLDISVPWTESNASVFSKIAFKPTTCPNGFPKSVDVYLSHGTPVTLYVEDLMGNVIDSAAASGSDPSVVDILTLSSNTGIREIRMEGAEICLKKICWYCEPTGIPTITPTRIPGEENCVTGENYIGRQTENLAKAVLGPITVHQAILPDGSSSPISIVDCDQDGKKDVSIPWTESNAQLKSLIEFNISACKTSFPKQVELFLTHGTPIAIEAIDPSGMVVDGAVGSGSDPTVVEKLVVQSNTGIQRIRIEGAEICLKKICWKCGEVVIPTPTERPQQGNCISGEDYTGDQKTDLAQIQIAPVTIKQAALSTGDPVPLSVVDCDQDGLLDISIPWSEASASQKATIAFDPMTCNPGLPNKVELFITRGNVATFEAKNALGATVDTQTATGSGVEMITLQSSTGIKTIVFTGSELCIKKICWYCVSTPPQPTPLPKLNCVQASEFYEAGQAALAEVTLGAVKITQALMMRNIPVPLQIMNCDQDNKLDVTIPWSEADATQPATIAFDAQACEGQYPLAVDVILSHGTPIKLEALDANGTVVDSVSDSSTDFTAVQTLKLLSADGIQSIRVIGSEICIRRICWQCRDITSVNQWTTY